MRYHTCVRPERPAVLASCGGAKAHLLAPDLSAVVSLIVASGRQPPPADWSLIVASGRLTGPSSSRQAG